MCGPGPCMGCVALSVCVGEQLAVWCAPGTAGCSSFGLLGSMMCNPSARKVAQASPAGLRCVDSANGRSMRACVHGLQPKRT